MLNELSGKKRQFFINMPIYLRIKSSLHEFQGIIMISFALLNSEIKKKALLETALLERVAIHKSIYFASSWASYGTARKETLKLFPPARILKELEKDYALMESMLFREVPTLKSILKTIGQFEEEFNCITLKSK